VLCEASLRVFARGRGGAGKGDGLLGGSEQIARVGARWEVVNSFRTEAQGKGDGQLIFGGVCARLAIFGVPLVPLCAPTTSHAGARHRVPAPPREHLWRFYVFHRQSNSAPTPSKNCCSPRFLCASVRKLLTMPRCVADTLGEEGQVRTCASL
jgi:hypothetical protein